MRDHRKVFRPRESLLSLVGAVILSTGMLTAQNVTVTGVVYDSETKEPLMGATVVASGTTTAVTTGREGNFTISVQPTATLEISYIGYRTAEETLNGRIRIDVAMQQDAYTADEIVVVGYGTQRKVNLTGSVSTVNVTEAMASRSVSNVSGSLAGLVPGLTATVGTGMAGSNGATLLIRGLGTKNNANPLIVVDGMPDVDINRIDMNDIESISVLKDASSAAIYGSRAANGVILITTKSGKGTDKLSIDYNGSYSFNNPTSFYDFMTDYSKAMTLHQRASRAGRTSPYFSDGTIEQWFSGAMVDPVRYPNTDQLAWITRTGHLQNHTISASGSGDRYNFYISGGLQNETGYQINNDYKRYNFRSNTEYRIRSNVTVGMRIDGTWTEQSYPYANGFFDVDAANGHLPLQYAISGITPYNYETHQYGGAMAHGEAINAINLYADYNTKFYEWERQEFNGNTFIRWEPIPGLSGQLDYSLRYYNWFRKHWLGPTGLQLYNFQTGEPLAGTYIDESAPIRNDNFTGRKSLTQFRLNYEKEIFDGHELSIMAAAAEEFWYQRDMAASRNDRVHTNITEINGALATTQYAGGTSSSEGLRSYLGRLNYNMYGKYLAEFNFRVDGSSKFLPGHQYGFFPSGSVGWRFTEEKFLGFLRKYVSSGKIRASYGALGNNSGVSRSAQKDILGTTNYTFNNVLVKGFSVRKMINPDFTWEKTKIMDIGIDLGFFNNRLMVELDYYDRKTTGMISPSDLSMMLAGYDAPQVNMGDMRNKGIEANVRWNSRVRKFHYGANLNVSFNRDQLESWHEERNPSSIYVGMPYYFVYTLVATGIAQTWEDIYNAPYHGNNNISPGDILYKDLNGDGQITGADSKAFKNRNMQRPTGNYGLTLFGEWKGIDINMLFQATTGKWMYWMENLNTPNPGAYRHAFQEMHWNDSWSLDNRYNTTLPRLISGNGARNFEGSTYWLQNASFLRMKNIQIGYNLPQKVLKALTLSRCRFYFSAENLFTLTAWKGPDPDKTRYDKPIADDPYPVMKTVSFGINIGF